MAILLNLVSPVVTNPKSQYGFISKLPNNVSYKRSSKILACTDQISVSPDGTFLVPNWRVGKTNDYKTRELLVYDAFKRFQNMADRGHKPDLGQGIRLLYDLCSLSKSEKSIRVMLALVKAGYRPNGATYTHLVNYLCKKRKVGHAMLLMERMEDYGYPISHVSAFNTVIKGLCTQGKLNLQILEKMFQKGFVPNSYTYSILIEAVAREKGGDEALKVLNAVLDNGGQLSLVSYNVVITALCKEGRIDDAIRLFRELPSKGFSPNSVTYNILLGSLSTKGRWAEATALLGEMNGKDCSPSIITYNILIDALAKIGEFDVAFEILKELRKGGFNPMSSSYNLILYHLCGDGKLDLATKCLDNMIYHGYYPNDRTYNAIARLCAEGTPSKVLEAFTMIQGLKDKQRFSKNDFYKGVISCLCKKGNTHAAFQLLYEMTKDGYLPDSHTYCSLIKGLCHEGMLVEAMVICRVMEEFDYYPDTGMFNCLIVGLCKQHRTDLAIEVMVMMVETGQILNEKTYSSLVEGIANEEHMDLAKEVLKVLQEKRALKRNAVERLCMQYDFELIKVGKDGL